MLAISAMFAAIFTHASAADQRKICDEIAVGNADEEHWEQWIAMRKQRPSCAKPPAYLGLTLVNKFKPALMLYMPGAPRDCPDVEKQRTKSEIMGYAVQLADEALAIERDYVEPWYIKLHVYQPDADYQVDMPACSGWYMGDSAKFMQVVRDGVLAISSATDRLEFIRTALTSTIVQGYFRDTGQFQQSKNGIVPTFLSKVQQAELRSLALRELKRLPPGELDEYGKLSSRRLIAHLKNR